MADEDISAKELAAKLSRDPRTITRWRRGVVRPDGDSRFLLEELSRGVVAVSLWSGNVSGKAA